MPVFRQCKLLALMVVSIYACDNNRSDVSENPYIISEKDSIYHEKRKKDAPPPPPMLFYGQYNFIIDTSEKVYIHFKRIYISCRTGLDDSKPDFLDLTPSDLVVVDKSYIASFLLDNVQSSNNNKSIAVISGVSDTLVSTQFQIVRRFLQENQTRFFWHVRRITEEESVVLYHKKQNLPYLPYNIKWTNNFSLNQIPYSSGKDGLFYR